MIYTTDINNLFMSPIYTKCKKYYHASLLIKKEFVFIISFEKVNIFMMCICYLLNIRFWQWSDEMGRFLQWINLQQILYVSNKIIFFFSTWNKINTYIEIFGISYIWILTVKKNPYFFVGNSIQMCLEYVYRLYILRSRYVL